MLRFMIKVSRSDGNTGATLWFKTIDADIPELEQELKQGGTGPGLAFEAHELIGIEVLTDGR